MLTPFGKAIRKIRIDNNMTLSAMAARLEVSPTFLTAVETGRKAVPATLPQRVAAMFASTSDIILKQLQEAAEQSKTIVKIAVGHGARDQQREIAALFARQFSELTDDQIEKLRPILKSCKE